MTGPVLAAAGGGDVRYAVVAVAAILIAVRLWFRFGRGRRGSSSERPARSRSRRPAGTAWDRIGGATGLVAQREIRERLRSRTFKVGTVIVLLVVAAGIVIPVLRRGHHAHASVGMVGTLSAPLQATVVAAGTSVGTPVTLVPEPSVEAAEQDLKDGKVALVIDRGGRLIVNRAISPTDTSSGALLVRVVSEQLSLQGGLEAAGLSPARAATLAHPPPLPVTSLQPARKTGTSKVTAIYGLILLYVLLTQYGTWIMMGVVEEKSSRVVEVLLSTLRPVQLLAGKVIGIGTLALAQAAGIVAVALLLAQATGSDLLKGSGPLEVLSILLWLLLGYIFYCWVYAAGGALADRQEHLQTLAFPMQIPILFGYIVSITSIGSNTPSTFVHVLAYLPPTAPFAMSVMVADSAVTWWQFLLSALVTVAATVAVARLAATVYSRAVLRTGQRVHLRDVLSRTANG